jgi:hypothetical protein
MKPTAFLPQPNPFFHTLTPAGAGAVRLWK